MGSYRGKMDRSLGTRFRLGRPVRSSQAFGKIAQTTEIRGKTPIFAVKIPFACLGIDMFYLKALHQAQGVTHS
ncbi:MAG TPA: hypothetical protein VGW99_05800 [Chthoniobacterales bacterium]|nr:hypothetical protein [Chthoniobacterales bacterium]